VDRENPDGQGNADWAAPTGAALLFFCLRRFEFPVLLRTHVMAGEGNGQKQKGEYQI
jgi:hypothetical protein